MRVWTALSGRLDAAGMTIPVGRGRAVPEHPSPHGSSTIGNWSRPFGPTPVGRAGAFPGAPGSKPAPMIPAGGERLNRGSPHRGPGQQWPRAVSAERPPLDSGATPTTGRWPTVAKFVTIGYGDQEGYDSTDPAVRDDAHAHDARLQGEGAEMGIAGTPVQVRNHSAAGVR